MAALRVTASEAAKLVSISTPRDVAPEMFTTANAPSGRKVWVCQVIEVCIPGRSIEPPAPICQVRLNPDLDVFGFLFFEGRIEHRSGTKWRLGNRGEARGTTQNRVPKSKCDTGSVTGHADAARLVAQAVGGKQHHVITGFPVDTCRIGRVTVFVVCVVVINYRERQAIGARQTGW